MRVKPADPTAVIRDPHTKRPLPADGGDVPDNHFWRRRLRDGEVVRVVEAAPAKRIPEPAPPHVEPAPRAFLGNEPIPPLTTREPNKG